MSGQSTIGRCILGKSRLAFFITAFFASYSVVWQHSTLLLPRDDVSSANSSVLTGTATSGRRCSLVKLRNFDRQKLFYNEAAAAETSGSSNVTQFVLNKSCRYWGTLTTIFNPTEAVFTLPSDWCLVVAADLKGSSEYEVGPNTVLLSVEKQVDLAKHFDLVDSLPWNHFARKNVAYLFAIINKAEWVWDFDDDNILYTTPDTSADVFKQGVLFEPSNKTSCGALNPYQWLKHPPGRKTNTSFWPRGYPLELIKSPSCEAVSRCVVNEPKVGIFQAIADSDPDVDAIYRLTGRLPVYFNKGTKEPPILVPNGMLSPMNAQAALVHVERASWSLFLPTTVHGRVSDIWRSYITQAVGRFYGLQTAFLPDPLVRQDRNAHDYLADFNSEIPLYECAGALVNLLNGWQAPGRDTSLPTSLIELYIELYEHGVVEAHDVDLIQHWLHALGRAGYTFPIWDDAQYNTKCSPFSGRDNPSVDASTTATTVAVPVPSNVGEMAEEMTGSPEKTFFTDVAMVGQFNFEAHPDHVIHWVKRWREVFRVVSVWGPFSPETYEILTDRGIDVVLYQGDKGYYSPLRNLGRSLVRFASDSTLQGVIIAHDDILIDVSSLEKLGFPGDGNILVQGPLEELFIFSDNSTIWDEKEGTFVDVQKRMTGIARKWSWWPNVLPTFSDALSKDPRSSAYVDASGMATLYAMVPGDFVYVPTKYAKPFHDMAEWLADNKVFLEASMITTVLHLRDRYMANVTHLETCTAWGRDRHRTAKFVTDCRRSGRAFELYHPIKISSGLETWDAYFDEMVTRNGSSAL